MTRARVVLVMLVVALSFAPAPAYAHIGFWDWLEELSGPGPFRNGWMFDLRPICFVQSETVPVQASPAPIIEPPKATFAFGSGGDSNRRIACQTNRTIERAAPPPARKYRVRGYLEVRAGAISAEANTPLFQDRPTELIGRAKAWTLELLAFRQVDPAIAIGVGGGVIGFSGTNVAKKPKQLVLTPLSVEVLPLKLLAENYRFGGLVSLRFDEMAVIGRLTANSFNDGSTSPFHTKRADLISSFAITVDFLALR